MGQSKWAAGPDYKAPIPFLEMQKAGRERVDGTVIIGKLRFGMEKSFVIREVRDANTRNMDIVACTDPRVTPEQFLGMKDGSSVFLPLSILIHYDSNLNLEATVVRTAGGRVLPALSTLYVLTTVGTEGKKGLIIVIHHTGNFVSSIWPSKGTFLQVQDCGLCHTTDEDIRQSLRRRATKPEELKEIDSMSFGSIEK